MAEWWSDDEDWTGVPPPARLDATTEEEDEEEEEFGEEGQAGTSFDRSFIDDEHWTWDAFVQGDACRLCGQNIPGSGESEENFGMEHMIKQHFRDLEVSGVCVCVCVCVCVSGV